MRLGAALIALLAHVRLFTRTHVGEGAHVFLSLRCVCVCAAGCTHVLACQLMSPVIQQWACCGLAAGSRGWESHSRLQLSLAGGEARMPSLYCLHTGWSLKVCVDVCCQESYMNTLVSADFITLCY